MFKKEDEEDRGRLNAQRPWALAVKICCNVAPTKGYVIFTGFLNDPYSGKIPPLSTTKTIKSTKTLSFIEMTRFFYCWFIWNSKWEKKYL